MKSQTFCVDLSFISFSSGDVHFTPFILFHGLITVRPRIIRVYGRDGFDI
jgi:hypothetical protein